MKLKILKNNDKRPKLFVFWREPDRVGNKFSDIYKIAAVTLMVMPRVWTLKDFVALGYCFENAVFTVKNNGFAGT